MGDCGGGPKQSGRDKRNRKRHYIPAVKQCAFDMLNFQSRTSFSRAIPPLRRRHIAAIRLTPFSIS
jgi:hypothetical protein